VQRGVWVPGRVRARGGWLQEHLLTATRSLRLSGPPAHVVPARGPAAGGCLRRAVEANACVRVVLWRWCCHDHQRAGSAGLASIGGVMCGGVRVCGGINHH
jgi:hypothetical protein